MKHIKAFIPFINEDRRQLELPFDIETQSMFSNPHPGDPLHDKPVHVHVLDALEDMSTVKISDYKTHKNIDDVWDNGARQAYDMIGKNLDENNEFNLNASYFFVAQFHKVDLDDEDLKRTFLASFIEDNISGDTFDESAAQENILKDIESTLSPEGIKDYEIFRSNYFVNEFSQDLYSNINSNIDENGYINIWRTVVFNQIPVKGAEPRSMYKDVYIKIVNEHGGVGQYWTYDEKSPEAYFGMHGGPNELELTLCGKTRVEDIDWTKTIYANAAIPDEKEINIKGNGLVMVYELRTDKYNQSKREKGTFSVLEKPIVVPVGR